MGRDKNDPERLRKFLEKLLKHLPTEQRQILVSYWRQTAQATESLVPQLTEENWPLTPDEFIGELERRFWDQAERVTNGFGEFCAQLEDRSGFQQDRTRRSKQEALAAAKRWRKTQHEIRKLERQNEELKQRLNGNGACGGRFPCPRWITTWAESINDRLERFLLWLEARPVEWALRTINDQNAALSQQFEAAMWRSVRRLRWLQVFGRDGIRLLRLTLHGLVGFLILTVTADYGFQTAEQFLYDRQIELPRTLFYAALAAYWIVMEFGLGPYADRQLLNARAWLLRCAIDWHSRLVWTALIDVLIAHYGLDMDDEAA